MVVVLVVVVVVVVLVVVVAGNVFGGITIPDVPIKNKLKKLNSNKIKNC